MSQINAEVEAFRKEFATVKRVTVPCPICGRSTFDKLHDQDRHGLGFNTCVCTYCSLVQISPRPSDAWFNRFYNTFFWPVYIGSRFSSIDVMFIEDHCAEKAAQILEGIIPYLPKAPRCYLDVGSGLGGTLSEFRKRFPDSEMQGVEPSGWSAAFCKERLGIDVHNVDWITLSDADLHGPYDLITMVHVLEHVLDPVAFLERAVKRLDSDGVIYVEVPNILSDHWSGPDVFHIAHIYNFHEVTLGKIMSRVGLETIHVFHSLATKWPWAVGVLARRSPLGPVLASEILPAAREELDSLKMNVLTMVHLAGPARRRFPARRAIARLARTLGLCQSDKS